MSCGYTILPKAPFPQMRQWRGLPEVEESQNMSLHPEICLWNHRICPPTATPHTFEQINVPSTLKIFRRCGGANPYHIGMQLRKNVFYLHSPDWAMADPQRYQSNYDPIVSSPELGPLKLPETHQTSTNTIPFCVSSKENVL